MADKNIVWIMSSRGNELDQQVFEALKTELSGKAEIILRERTEVDQSTEGMAEKLLRSLVGEKNSEEHNWLDLLGKSDTPNPDVVVTSQISDIRQLDEISRQDGPRPVRIALIREPRVSSGWLKSQADLFAVSDEYAASSARDIGNSVRITGVPVSEKFAPSGNAPSDRQSKGFGQDSHVILITADSFEPHEINQILVQLGLVRIELEVLFEVQHASYAEKLRRIVPSYGISASLIPYGEEGAGFWPLAHLIVGRARPLEVYRARAVQIPFLAAPPRGRSEKTLAEGLVASGAGRSAESLATFAVDIDLTLEPQRYEEISEAQRSLSVASSRSKLARVISEAIDRKSEFTSPRTGLPKGLERISSGRPRDKKTNIGKFEEAASAATEVRDRSEAWSQRAKIARAHGDEELALEADKRASRHREVLTRLLDSVRSEGAEERTEEADIEEEIERLRRKAVAQENVEHRLRSLEIEDELQALKEKLDREE